MSAPPQLAPPGPSASIPDWSIAGVLPPFIGSSPAMPDSMAPFPATMVQIVEKFGKSPERIQILLGLLDFRQALDKAGLVQGFQWLDGSFFEDVEKLESRSPNDIDIITIFRRPASCFNDNEWEIFVQANRDLFLPIMNKKSFRCDTYWIDLNIPSESIVEQTKYWYGLFSHRRNGLWKGMLKIPLSVGSDDAHARALLLPPAAVTQEA
jgi:hypothetical protein